MLEGRRRARQLRGLIIGATVVLVAIVWATLIWQAYATRDAALGRARDVTASLSRALREQAEQTFTAVDTALRSVEGQLRQSGADKAATHRMLRHLRDGASMLQGIGIVDAEGRVSASADTPTPAPLDLSDRPYFQSHRDRPELGTLIGEPVLSRPGNMWVIPVSRRTVDENGRFTGLVAARVRTDYFNRIYKAVSVKTVALYHRDGMLLAQEPDDEFRADARYRPSVALLALIHGRANGVLEDPSPVDGVLQTYGYSSARTHPLTVIVGIDRSAVLAVWWRELAIVAAVALLLTVAVIGFAVLLLERVNAQWRLAVQLAAARDAEETAKLTAEAANRAKADFLAQMSHELRTPLNAINGFSDIMAREMFGPIMNQRYREYAGIIKQSGEHLLVIINNILDIAKVEAGQWQIEPGPVDIGRLIAELGVLTQERARTCDVSVTFAAAADGDGFVSDDRLLLQILLNLMTNAIKFTPAGGRVSLTVDRMGDAMRFTVTDTGEGMSPGDLARIFEPYARGSSALGRLRHGTGLGLSLSRRFAVLLGGTLALESAVGIGTAATVTLPLAPPPG